MISYKLYLKNPAAHYIYVDMTIDEVSGKHIQLQLPAWRPGRYELGNFAKNVKRLDAFDGQGNPLNYTKLNKDLWQVETNGAKSIKVTYSYYAAEINAGSCYADASQLYVNPVHLCLYVPDRAAEQHKVELEIPEHYKIAGSMKMEGRTLYAANFDELADSPFIASAAIQSDSYEVGGIRFWLHFNGECRPAFDRIKGDFEAFTKTQLSFWGDFPVSEYHFLFQVLPHRFYHGVEHQRSTVIALGPGYALNSGKTYEDLLGVSSHELFHTWNIKYIRPQEMLPYDFTKENYARTGYVYEGFTTYYGDLMLRAAGVFSNEQYFETLEERLNKHFHNYGRFNLSVAGSSWDTWLDGYVPGAPYRKTSIYDEGNLVAFMLDVLIMKHSGNTRSLRDVCRSLYNDYGKKHKGYTEHDIIALCEAAAGASLQDLFKGLVYGTDDYEPLLAACFDYVGLEMVKVPAHHTSDRVFGFKTVDSGHARKVSLVAPYSPAWKAGLGIGDEVLAVNGYTLRNDLDDWLNYFLGDAVRITVSSAGQLRELELKQPAQAAAYFDVIRLKAQKDMMAEKESSLAKWLGQTV